MLCQISAAEWIIKVAIGYGRPIVGKRALFITNALDCVRLKTETLSTSLSNCKFPFSTAKLRLANTLTRRKFKCKSPIAKQLLRPPRLLKSLANLRKKIPLTISNANLRRKMALYFSCCAILKWMLLGLNLPHCGGRRFLKIISVAMSSCWWMNIRATFLKISPPTMPTALY